MKTTINQYQFCEEFKVYNREYNFSIGGLFALFDYLEDYEESTGEEIELDVISLCCDYSEWENWEEFSGEYDNITSMEDLLDHTTVIEIEGTERFITQAF